MLPYIAFLIFLILSFVVIPKTFHAKKKYFWYEYCALIIIPVAAMFGIYLATGLLVVVVFACWCICGPLLEALGGYAFLNITGKHLWLYERYPLFNRTTSILIAPLWGLTGVAIFAFDRVIALMFK